ncbi:nucleotide exchange factor GrpE [Nocardioides sp. HDW12B]|uniref:nucleotide exchange factor GrpE n=1 Tax=Nocardioides sp. HDW12B TaxID=2714939 RepID=UPI00140E6137|nr:nucleotide exchange factor GrpE [Nocardioides sp. HDW12B]QIK67382.1 nucleotide exchange factor GrpE [Nocardioides sp. HDW12B]
MPQDESDDGEAGVGDPGHADVVGDPSGSNPEAAVVSNSRKLPDLADDTGTDDEVVSPDGPSVGPAFDELTSALLRVEAQSQAFHARAENYEQIIRQMQNRIEQLQGDQVQALLKPVFQRFAGLHAQATEASEGAKERGESAEKDFSFFAVAIEEALGLVDLESVGAVPEVEFDSRKHHASRIVPTDDPDLDKRVQRVLRQGFTYVGAPRVLLPAQVSVYRYEPPQPIANDEPPTSSPTSEPGEGDPGE